MAHQIQQYRTYARIRRAIYRVNVPHAWRCLAYTDNRVTVKEEQTVQLI